MRRFLRPGASNIWWPNLLTLGAQELQSLPLAWDSVTFCFRSLDWTIAVWELWGEFWKAKGPNPQRVRGRGHGPTEVGSDGAWPCAQKGFHSRLLRIWASQGVTDTGPGKPAAKAGAPSSDSCKLWLDNGRSWLAEAPSPLTILSKLAEMN